MKKSAKKLLTIFVVLICVMGSVLPVNYNGPPVKTTISNFIVNQIFPILTLAASRATPHLRKKH